MILKYDEFTLNENESDFNIGDEVLYGYERGIVTRLIKDQKSVIVRFYNPWTAFLNSDDGRDKSKKSYRFSINDNSLKKYKQPKIIINENDPYGEEDWNEY